jgi:hypothetical protein
MNLTLIVFNIIFVFYLYYRLNKLEEFSLDSWKDQAKFNETFVRDDEK